MRKRKLWNLYDFYNFSKWDLPPEKILNLYPFFNDIKSNPFLYLKSSGYIKGSRRIEFSLFRIIILILIIGAPAVSIPVVLFFLGAKYIFEKIRNASDSIKGSGNICGYQETGKIRIGTKKLLDFLNMRSIQQFIDIATSSISAKDIVSAMLAEKAKLLLCKVFNAAFYIMTFFSVIVCVVYDMRFLYFYVPAYLFCASIIFNKKHNMPVKMEMRKMRDKIGKIETLAYYGEGVYYFIRIFLLVFGLFILFVVLFLSTHLFMALAEFTFNKTGGGIFFALSLFALIVSFLYPVVMLRLSIRTNDIDSEEEEFNLISKNLSELIQYTVYSIEEPTLEKMGSPAEKK